MPFFSHSWWRALAVFAVFGGSVCAAPAPDDVGGGLHWRLVGPFRGGFAPMAVGVPGQPDTYYFGAAGGGVWKTEDSGQTWHSIADNLAAPAVEAIAVAPSDAQVLYAGTGLVEARYDTAAGSGVYKSTDGGKTWSAAGLAATRHIGQILVDPQRADTLLVAALGHYFGPNPERGVFRSEDGGKTWQQTLKIDANTGAVDLAADPEHAATVYAAAWQVRNYPWLSYFQPNGGPGSGVYKSTDGGRSWRRLAGTGWPQGDLGRIGLAAASGNRVYAVVKATPGSGNIRHAVSKNSGGLYRSDDGGASWQRISDAGWLQSDYFARLTVDPKNRDRLYSAGQSIRVSNDGGKTWEMFKGAPGGDDYHYLWINPQDPRRMVTASDQGTVVTVDGGKSWSDWYNQPTGQFYHLATDNRFPYWIYSGQQDSGTVRVASRSDYGVIGARDWHPVGGDERDYDVPDAHDPDIVYGSGLGGRLSRWDARTGEVQNVSPWPLSTYGARPTTVQYRYTWITPIAVSAVAPYPIYQGAQVLFRSLDQGATWTTISPDLSAKRADAKNCSGDLAAPAARDCGYGVIYTIALSPRDNDEIWVGTDDGVIRLTRDGGKHWDDVTPAKLVAPWAKVATLDLSATQAGTAYAAIDNHRQDEFRPHVLRTHDYGKTWTEIDTGLPPDHFVGVVRADPVKAGLLYAGTDTGVFVSYDDGAHWSSLQRDLPTAWVRDLAVHGDDLIAATQGRAIWVLDDVTPLRQHDKATIEGAVLFEPAVAVRVRGSQNKDTPPPADTPLGENPPTGAIIDYQLGRPAKKVALEIHDAAGKLVRRFASDESERPTGAEAYFAPEWIGKTPRLSQESGAHRFVWNLREPRPRAVHYDFSIAAVHGAGTPVVPEGMLVAPGTYKLTLDVDGRKVETTLQVRADPRVALDAPGLQQAQALAQQVTQALDGDFVAYGQLHAVDEQIGKIERDKAAAPLKAALAAFDKATKELRSGEGPASENLDDIGGVLSALATDLEGSDRAPTAPQRDLFALAAKRLTQAQQRWQRVQGAELVQLDAQLKAAGLPVIVVPAPDKVQLDEAPESTDLP